MELTGRTVLVTGGGSGLGAATARMVVEAGGSVVAADVDARFVEARAIGQEVYERALTALGKQVRVPGVIRFNPSPFERDGVPGLGWAVASERPSHDLVPVELRPGIAERLVELATHDELVAQGERYAALFRHLLEQGVYLAPSQFEAMFISLAHGDEEIERTVDAVAGFGD
jgi:NAD(P)-dependent dehydrogenase (short-subunit alcohol dehydrogenase family)